MDDKNNPVPVLIEDDESEFDEKSPYERLKTNDAYLAKLLDYQKQHSSGIMRPRNHSESNDEFPMHRFLVRDQSSGFILSDIDGPTVHHHHILEESFLTLPSKLLPWVYILWWVDGGGYFCKGAAYLPFVCNKKRTLFDR